MLAYINVGDNVQVGDLVVSKDAKEKDCVYKVISINNESCTLKGVHYRIIKDDEVNNYKPVSEEVLHKENQKENDIVKRFLENKKERKERTKQRYILGKILHIDGDFDYLEKCLKLYNEVGIYAYGVLVDEKKMPLEIMKHISEVDPDVIVITGHDLYNDKGLKDISNYKNTKYFVQTVKTIRSLCENPVIIAGACQSNFEALIASGADFASSPARINVHTFDPAVIAIKAATTSFAHVISSEEIYKYIENGRNAYGGLQTLGKMRLLI